MFYNIALICVLQFYYSANLPLSAGYILRILQLDQSRTHKASKINFTASLRNQCLGCINVCCKCLIDIHVVCQLLLSEFERLHDLKKKKMCEMGSNWQKCPDRTLIQWFSDSWAHPDLCYATTSWSHFKKCLFSDSLYKVNYYDLQVQYYVKLSLPSGLPLTAVSLCFTAAFLCNVIVLV